MDIDDLGLKMDFDALGKMLAEMDRDMDNNLKDLCAPLDLSFLEMDVMNDKTPREILNVTQAADYLGVARGTLYRWIEVGKVPARKVGSKWLLSRQQLLKFVEQPEQSA